MSRHVDTTDIGRAVIDSLEFAREDGVLAGDVPVAHLGRLAEALADNDGLLACELRGGRDGEGKPFLRLRLEGSINVRCQRCLSALPFVLDIDSRLALVAPGETWPDEELADDGVDAIEADREQSVLQLIEDEVLLALPISPRHEDCRPSAAVGKEQGSSPFAALAGLKKH
jgi:uncharacterized protein